MLNFNENYKIFVFLHPNITIIRNKIRLSDSEIVIIVVITVVTVVIIVVITVVVIVVITVVIIVVTVVVITVVMTVVIASVKVIPASSDSSNSSIHIVNTM